MLSNIGIKKEDIFSGKLNLHWLLYSQNTLSFFCDIVEKLLKENNIRNKEFYRMLLCEIYLIRGLYSKANYWAKYLPKQKSWNADFSSISEIKTILETEVLKISYDTNLDFNLVKFLTENLYKLVKDNYPKLYPIPHFILIKGKEFSPFIDGLRTAFFMIDHYQMKEHDKEIFQYTILHEMQHYIIYQKQATKLSSDANLFRVQYNNFKFFDEGIAITKGYSCLSLEKYYSIHDNNIAYIINKFSNYTISDIMNGWLDLFFEVPSLPLYEFAHSFIGFLVKMFDFNYVLNFTIKIEKRGEKSIEQEFFDYFNISLNKIVQKWKEMLFKKGIQNKNEFITIKEISRSDNKYIFQYKSKYPIWIKQSILAVSDNKLITNIHSLNKYRYQKEGKFEITLENKHKPIVFYCFFRDKSQIINWK